MTRAERVYRRLLRLYPRQFRDEFGEEMAALFRERSAERSFRLWLQVLGDLVFLAPREHGILLKQDLRYALRALRRAPLFAFTVIATLALGIGANSLVFSAVDAVLLRDVAVSDPDSLVDVFTSSGPSRFSSSSYPDYFDLRDSGAFASVAAYAPVSMTLDTGAQLEPIAGQLVSDNYFSTIGVAIPVGRAFTRDEDRAGAPVRVAVLSQALWQRAFNGDRTRVGTAIRLNGVAYTLIGVAPAGFSGLRLGEPADVWVPTALQPEVDPASAALRRKQGHAAKFDLRGSRGLSLVGRLPGGIDLEQARSRVETISTRLEAAYPATNRSRQFVVAPLGDGRGFRVATRPILQRLGGAVLIVLLVACVNVAGLLLARSVSREQEVALRVALGASRARLVRQWLTESMLLGVLGSLGALLVVLIGTPLLHAFVVPQDVALSINARVLTVTLLAGLGVGLVFGLAPGLPAMRRHASASLRDRGNAGSVHAARLRAGFVIAQIALSLVLLVGAGLFLRTLRNAYPWDLGYRLDRTLVASLNLEPRGYFEGGPLGAAAGQAVYEQALARIEALPGVVSAAAARMTVLAGSARATAVSADGRPLQADRGNALGVRVNVVSRRYFETMNLPLVRGRGFEASDGAATPRVVVVSQSLADRLWPRADPVGQTIWDDSARAQVIGVVPDAAYATTVERNPPPGYYLLLAQNYESAVALHVRTADSPNALIPAIRDAVRQVDSQLAVERPQLLGDVLARTLASQRLMATVVALFGAMALVLSVIGLYSVMAHAVVSRRQEIGVRLAMGASRRSIVTLLLAGGARLIALGVALGLAGTLLGSRYVEAQLFGVTATDPLTLLGGCGLLILAGFVASLAPAIRAMRIDPIVTLRQP